MNYYQPREIKDKNGQPTGKWHYTCMNDGKIWPVGYCAKDCPGHVDKEGAYAHQKEYELDFARYDVGLSSNHEIVLRKCFVCSRWTTRAAQLYLSGSIYILCEEHCNRAGLSEVLIVGDAIASF